MNNLVAKLLRENISRPKISQDIQMDFLFLFLPPLYNFCCFTLIYIYKNYFIISVANFCKAKIM